MLGWNESDFIPRTFSMHKFLPHESVSNGSFNLDHNTVLPQFKVWEDELGNTEEGLWLLISRLEKDFASLNPSMRKPWISKDVATGIGKVYVFWIFLLCALPKSLDLNRFWLRCFIAEDGHCFVRTHCRDAVACSSPVNGHSAQRFQRHFS